MPTIIRAAVIYRWLDLDHVNIYHFEIFDNPFLDLGFVAFCDGVLRDFVNKFAKWMPSNITPIQIVWEGMQGQFVGELHLGLAPIVGPYMGNCLHPSHCAVVVHLEGAANGTPRSGRKFYWGPTPLMTMPFVVPIRVQAPLDFPDDMLSMFWDLHYEVVFPTEYLIARLVLYRESTGEINDVVDARIIPYVGSMRRRRDFVHP